MANAVSFVDKITVYLSSLRSIKN